MFNKERVKPTVEEKAIGAQLIMTHLDIPMRIPDIGSSTVVRDYTINGKRFQITLLNVSECYRRKAGWARGVWLLADRYIPLSKKARRLMCCASIRLS
jgi:hypothetical protein